MSRPRIQTDRETKILFAFAPPDSQPDGVPVITLMMPQKAWEYMNGGMSHDFDLTNIGIPMKIIIGRCRDHAHGMAILEQANGGALKRSGYKDVRDHLDVSIDPDRKAEQ
jgi:hypothetical protein